jgi:DNA (cytosine-5)-methyltransferase 1
MELESLLRHGTVRRHNLVNGLESWATTSNGLLVPGHTLPPAAPTCLDFFAGAGGFSCGFINEGWQVLAGFDNSPEAAWTYTYNLGAHPMQFVFVTEEDRQAFEKLLKKGLKKKGVVKMGVSGQGWIKHEPTALPVPYFFLGDVRKLKGEEVLRTIGRRPGEIDCIIGGPPCQGFSRSGKQDVMDPRNSLVFEFARLVWEIQPKCMVMENVPELATMVTPEGARVLDVFCQMLAGNGYSTYEALKRSLAGMKGARAAVRRDYQKEKLDNKEDSRPPAGQLRLFD